MGSRAGQERRRGRHSFDAQIHRRLLDADPVAPSILAETYLPRLIARLRRKYPRVAEDQVMQAAADAVLKYAERPGRYDPARLTLEGYLTMDAGGDLLNALARRRPRKSGPVRCPACGEGLLGRVPGQCPACGIAVPRGVEPGWRRATRFEAVAEDALARNTSHEPGPAEAVEQSEALRGAGELMRKTMEAVADPRDQELVRLILAGERRTPAFSAVLGLEGLDTAEQRRIVKQHKDRLTQRLRRLGKRLHE